MPKITLAILAVVAVAGWAAAVFFMSKSNDLESMLNASRAELATAGDTLASVQQNFRKHRDATGQLDEVSQKVASATAKLDELTPQFEARRSELQALQQGIDTGKSELSTLKRKIEVSESELTDVTHQIELARIELENVRSAAEQQRRSATPAVAKPPPTTAIEARPPSPTSAMPSVSASTTVSEEGDLVTEAKLRFQIIYENRDAKIDRIEFKVKSVHALALIDINRDGYVTIDETLLAPEGFERFDTDRDGKISSLEFVNADILRAIDSDSDGIVTLDEYLDLVRASAR